MHYNTAVSFTLKLTSNHYFDAMQTLFPLGNANLLLDKYVKAPHWLCWRECERQTAVRGITQHLSGPRLVPAGGVTAGPARILWKDSDWLWLSWMCHCQTLGIVGNISQHMCVNSTRKDTEPLQILFWYQIIRWQKSHAKGVEWISYFFSLQFSSLHKRWNLWHNMMRLVICILWFDQLKIT